MIPTNLGPKPEDAPFRMIAPLPADAPLVSLADAAAYLRVTPRAFRKLLDEERTSLADSLRSCVVRLSPRRRYLMRERFLALLGRLRNDTPSGTI